MKEDRLFGFIDFVNTFTLMFLGGVVYFGWFQKFGGWLLSRISDNGFSWGTILLIVFYIVSTYWGLRVIDEELNGEGIKW